MNKNYYLGGIASMSEEACALFVVQKLHMLVEQHFVQCGVSKDEWWRSLQMKVSDGQWHLFSWTDNLLASGTDERAFSIAFKVQLEANGFHTPDASGWVDARTKIIVE